MVGKITITPPNVCCQRFVTIMGGGRYLKNDNTAKTINKFKRIFSKHVSLVIFIFLFIFLLFVLYITNQKPSYKHTEHIYDGHALHNAHNSKFHYGIVIDCGSSGSRVYIYYWPPHSGGKEELLKMKQMIDVDGNPVRLKIKPGISSFADNPFNASHSLAPLLRFAAHHIPHKKHQETPIYILATAGMRILPKVKQNAILHNLKVNIPKMSEFYFTESQVEVISGKQEGIYLWIATNYVLGRFDHTHDLSTTAANTVSPFSRKQTVGTIEIGGASLQIAYEVAQNQSVPAELGATINLGCDMHATIHEYKIYVTTFLGYGTDLARKRYIQHLYDKNKEKIRSHESIIDVCLPTDMVDEQEHNKTKFKVTGNGDFSQCQKALQPLINSTSHCLKPPCSFNGVHQTEIDYRNAEFYGFSEFWYSSNDVLRIGGKYDQEKLEKAAKHFCRTKWSMLKRHYAMGFYPKADDFRFKYQCFKSAWMTSVLHDGLNFPRQFKGLTTVQLIHGKEVQWTLGAILYRTRFMPLRDMKLEDKNTVKAQQYGGLWIIFREGFYPILFICAAIAVVFLVVYCRKIRKFSRTSAVYSGSRNFDVTVLPVTSNVPYDVRYEM
ncbi:ectonucleoside triphosphate diphosphohydrolase 7-like [Hydractinia symbiolongicarpus]|uniref:ectonucleoside triphosphate diphosphohydrolase 7-like n=1 Tax=Hydractinia symbiolongicarpus TaxID=13093 RepID=UPI00254EE49F|nr:ectonucleoside triphosphate diphosphohydrolase 7-like [Hydractinia symbiolongicarpus]